MTKPSSRPRDAAATRSAILAAARLRFTRDGYTGAGLRDIVAEAGVDIALVNRYFGGKEGLFRAAVIDSFDVAPYLEGPRDAAGARLAAHVLGKARDPDFDPMLVMLRSATDPRAAAALREGLEERFLQPLAAWIGGSDATTRAALVLSVLAGLDFTRAVLELQDMAGPNPAAVAAAGRLLQELLLPD